MIMKLPSTIDLPGKPVGIDQVPMRKRQMMENIPLLMNRYSQGDRDAFNRILGLYYGPVYRYCKELCGSEERAVRLCRDVFFELHHHMDAYSDVEPFETFLCGIARRKWEQQLQSTP